MHSFPLFLTTVFTDYDKTVSRTKYPIKHLFNVMSRNIESYKDFGSVVDFKQTKKGRGYCIRKYGFSIASKCHFKIMLKDRIFTPICNSLLDLRELHVSEVKLPLNSFKTFFHEFYHTVNKCNYSPIEEALTELNTHLFFKTKFKNFTNIDISNIDTSDINLSYSKYCARLIHILKFIGLTDSQIVDLIIDIKNRPFSEFDIDRHLALMHCESYADFIIFIDTYYYKCLDRFPSIEVKTYFNGDKYSNILNEFKGTEHYDLLKDTSYQGILREDCIIEYNDITFKTIGRFCS